MSVNPTGVRSPPDLPVDGHKGLAGHVAILAGSAGDGEPVMPGAAILCARAALRGGAGLVTLMCLDVRVWNVVAVAVPEALVLDIAGGDGAIGRVAIELERRSTDVVRAIGPGLGRGANARLLVEMFLADTKARVVVDADGLTAFAGRPEDLRRQSGALVVTPHPGEAARLLGRTIGAEPRVRRDAAREIAARTGGVCVLKGHGTVVDDGHSSWTCETGNPGLATAGTGDVLTGLAAAYLASVGQSFSIFEAACAATWVHGRAGDLAAARVGRRALIASDVVDHLGLAQVELAAR